MNSMTVFRHAARYNVLTPVALLAALCMTAAAPADDRVVAAGTTDSDGVQLNAGDSLTNAGTINNAPGAPAVYYFPAPGNITFILNEEGAVIAATGEMAIGIDGTLGAFTNHGTISTDSDNGLGTSGDVGAFLNTGSITGEHHAFGTDGSVETFVNEGTMTSINASAFATGGNVGSLANSGTMTGWERGVDVGGKVGSFVNSGQITGQTRAAVDIDGGVTTFENSGTLTGADWNAVYITGNVGSFLNTSTGVIVNADRMTRPDGNGVEIESAGTDVVASFVNDGFISADLTGGFGTGVRLNGPNPVGSFVNSGTILGAGSGVNIGAFTNFDNSGTISGGQHIGIYVDTDSGDFVNSGAISSMGEPAVVFDGYLESFTNATGGVLTGRRWDALYFDSGVGHFINEAGATIENADRLGESGNGVVFNTGTTSGGAVGIFENHGTIAGDPASPDSAGVGFFDDGNPMAHQTGAFLNTGAITGTGSGVVSDGGFGTFENSGTITGGQFAGVSVEVDTGRFMNSGVISSDDNGVFIKGAVQSFTNTGEILSNNERAVDFDGVVSAFENTGRIESLGNGVTFAGGFVTASNSGTIISTAPGGQLGIRIDQPGGTFTNSGTIEGSDVGVLYFLGTSGENTFINAGTVRGQFSAIAFDGNDAGADTLIIKTGSELFGEVRFGAGNDTFDFSDFQGSALLEVHGLAGETLVAGDNLYYFDEPNDIVGIVSSDGVTAAGQVVATDLAGQIANLVQSQLGEVTAPASVDLVLGYAPMPAESEAEQAMAVFDPVEPTSKVWGSVFGGASHDDAPDLGHVFGGLIAGGHMQPAAGTTLGLLGGYAASRLETGGNHTIDSGTGVFGVYGSQSVGVIEVDFSVLAGWSGHSSSRDFVALGVAETATADYSSWFIAPALGAAVPVLAMENGEMRIAARAGYIGGEVEGYSETGSSMNLTVGAQTISLLDGRIGLESEFAVGSIENPTRVLLEGGIFGQSNLGGNSVPISFLGQTQNVAAAGDSHFGIYGGFDVATDIGNGAELFAGADASLRDDGMISGVAKAGLSGSF